MNAALDTDECLRKGAIGAVGAIPGTLAAHPFDLLKMRQQVTGAPLKTAYGDIQRGRTVAAFWRGAGAGVTQKVLTRGPMFLVGNAATQAVQHASDLPRERAIMLGSACSGYCTGLCAAPAEWAKVQRGVTGDTGLPILRARGGLARLHGAGLRNALFDGSFFSTELAGRQCGLPPWL